MNWYTLLKFAKNQGLEDYAYIGHNISGGNVVFLWFMDNRFKFYATKASQQMQAHQLWDEYTKHADDNTLIAQGRYDILTDEVSLGGFPDDFYKNPRQLEYVKNKIEKTLYKEFGPTIIIRDVVN